MLRAFDNTIDDLSEFFENCDNLMEVIDTSSDCIDDKEFSAEFKYYENEDGVSINLNYDGGDEILNGSIDIEADDIPVEIRFSADDEQTMFSAPDFEKRVFGFNNETFGMDFVNSELCDMLRISDDVIQSARDKQFNPFDTSSGAKEYKSAIKSFFKSVDIDKSGAYIPGFAGQVYSINYSDQELVTLVEDCIVIANGGNRDVLNTRAVRETIEDIRDEIMDNHVSILVGIEGRKLVAVSLQIDGDEASVILAGDNVWNSITVYDDGDEELKGGIFENENGFRAEFYPAYDPDEKLIVSADDMRGEIKCSFEEYGYVFFKIIYSCINDEARVSVTLQPDSIWRNERLELCISPLKMSPTMLADSAVNIFNMSKDDLYEIAEDFIDYDYYDYYDYDDYDDYDDEW